MISVEVFGIIIYGNFCQMITAAQCRAARGLLGWSQQELARRASVGIVTVHQLEASRSEPRRATVDVIRRAFETINSENKIRDLEKRQQGVFARPKG